MEHTDSVWGRVLSRASALLKRYAGLRDGPQNSWSLVGRAAERFQHALPEARDADHAYALWTRAMVSVLNDLYRRQIVRPEGLTPAEELAAPESAGPPDEETLRALDDALGCLAEIDEQKAALVLLRHTPGMTWERLAERLELSVGKARRDWEFAVAWLRRELRRRGVDLTS